MRAIVLCLLLSVAAIWPAQAQASDAAIRGTIQGQIDALLQDDFATAFGFASPAIKGMFGSPERFGQMVRNGYPMVWRPAEVRYLGLREEGGRVWQRVMITDQGGSVHLLDYQMVPGGDGWQINGVHVLQGAGAGA